MNMAEENYDLKDEYDFSKMKSLGKGKYAGQVKHGETIIHLDADVAEYFHDDKSVNDALRIIIEIAANVSANGRK